MRGPLSLVKEGWEKAPKRPSQDIVDYVLALRAKMGQYMKEAILNLEDRQEMVKQ